ncbi:hypothetical protein TPENAI_20077 [Tenacibaculum litopenaei]|uniref:hypothetical protein n=1 Tax=Tenacibaculum litopenaei TaxID=396016 RepID=UPI0038938658
MSDQNTEQRKFNRFQGELSGSHSGLFAGTIASEMSKRNKDEVTQKKEKNRELLLSELEKVYLDLINEIDANLDAIHEAMQKNRDEWEERANRLNDIDDLLQEVKDGGELNVQQANKVIESAGKSILENATSADYYRVLIEIKIDNLEQIDTLDQSFVKLEEGEKFYHDLQEQANKIYNDQSLSKQDRLAAYARLNNEVGKTNFVEAALEIENQNQKVEMEDFSNTDYSQQVENSVNKISEIKLNF